ncbi:MAG: hypothetical protein QOI22_23, partial [Verrucomicrobiota bacterium]
EIIARATNDAVRDWDVKTGALVWPQGLECLLGYKPDTIRAGGRFLGEIMIRKIKGGYRLYSRKKNPKTGKRRNLGTFKTLVAAKKHEKAVQYFKRR